MDNCFTDIMDNYFTDSTFESIARNKAVVSGYTKNPIVIEKSFNDYTGTTEYKASLSAAFHSDEYSRYINEERIANMLIGQLLKELNSIDSHVIVEKEYEHFTKSEAISKMCMKLQAYIQKYGQLK